MEGELLDACCDTSVAKMVEAVVTTYWNAKMERPEVTRALYPSIVEIDNAPLIQAFGHWVDVATPAMFAGALDTVFADLPTVNLSLLTTIFGTVRSVFERNLPAAQVRAVHSQLL